MTIGEWLNAAKKKCSNAGRDADILEVELILCYVLDQNLDRSYLAAHGEQELTSSQKKLADELLAKRLDDKMPLAYLLKRKEFYGREFYVDQRVLIPRPETEALVDITKEIIGGDSKNSRDGKGWQIIDIGTGSSCIATTLKLELPKAEVLATDISKAALKVAAKNAKDLGAEIELRQADLLEMMVWAEPDFEDTPVKLITAENTVVVANLPYVDPNWPWLSDELEHEPEEALYADNGGLSEILSLMLQLLQSAEMLGRFLGPSDKADKENPRYNIYVVLELDSSQRNRLDRLLTFNFDGLDWSDSAEITFEKLKDLKSVKSTKYAVAFKISVI